MTNETLPEYVLALREQQAYPQQDQPILPTQAESGSWEVVIPKVGTGGQQRFVAPTLELLVSRLAMSQLHASRHIRYLKTKLNEATLPNDCYSVLPDFGSL